jgi:amidase
VLSITVRDSAVMLDAIHGPEPSSPYAAPAPQRPFAQEVGRDPGRLRIAFNDKSPYGDAIDREIAAAVRDVATLLAGLGHHVEERAPPLATDPAAVISTIVAANTALNVRLAEARHSRAMTENDFEIATLAIAHNAQKTTATDYVAAQLGAFQISRALATFFEGYDVFLCPTLCSPPLRIGELDTMSQDLSHIPQILRRYTPATAMFNILVFNAKNPYVMGVTCIFGTREMVLGNIWGNILRIWATARSPTRAHSASRKPHRIAIICNGILGTFEGARMSRLVWCKS